MPHTTPSDPGAGSRRRWLPHLPGRLIAVCAALGAVLLAPGTTGTAGAAGSVDGDAYRTIGVRHGATDQEAAFDDVLGKAHALRPGREGETGFMRLRAECPVAGGAIVDGANDPAPVRCS